MKLKKLIKLLKLTKPTKLKQGRGRVGRSGKRQKKKQLCDRPTHRPTNRKVGYRVACPRLKTHRTCKT